MEAGIYGPNTVEQIKGGKHMKRSIEAYTTMYIVLHKLYIEKILDTNPAIEKDIRQVSARVADDLAEQCQKRNKSGVQEIESDIIGALKSTCFPDVQKNFDSQPAAQCINQAIAKNDILSYEQKQQKCFAFRFYKASRLQNIHYLVDTSPINPSLGYLPLPS